ncbi:MAG: TIGR03905 family TSCPD domain-containing protein [Bacteroidales bacterium]|nr:TIGR03905 family TSCPD domain-containing protein [Bacteroidales bacterium]
MKKYTYYPQGTCSVQIDFEVDDNGRIHNVQFLGGCNGNLQGIGVLVEGMPIEEVRAKLGGIRCGYKNTSCPDQLAQALEKVEI